MKHKTLYNTYAKSPCGYCKEKECSITVKQLKKKKCLQKGCWHLVKYPNHEYWKQREILKKKKKEHKKALTELNYSI